MGEFSVGFLNCVDIKQNMQFPNFIMSVFRKMKKEALTLVTKLSHKNQFHLMRLTDQAAVS